MISKLRMYWMTAGFVGASLAAQSYTAAEAESTADGITADNNSQQSNAKALDNGVAKPGTSDAAEGGSLAEIIVTAQKRSERLQDVPSSMMVLSGDKLAEEGVVQLSDYSKQVPGLTFSAASGPGQGQPELRGIATGGDRGSLVGIYLDDVPFTPSSPNAITVGFAFDPDLADIERIEVLEGPQSTLYGASAMGGLIKFVTKKPDLDNFEGSVRIDGSQVDGGGAGYGFRGSVNIPVVTDQVAVKASAFYRKDPGFVDNDYYGQQDVNRASVKGAQVSLRVKFNSDLENTLTGFVQDTNAGGKNQIFIDPDTLKPLSGRLSYSSPIAQPVDIQYQSLANTTTYDMSFATLTNVASYASLSYTNVIDYSLFADLFGAPAGDATRYEGDQHSKRLTDELRLASKPGRLEWLVAGFYTHEKDPDLININGTDSSGTIVPPSNPLYNYYNYNTIAWFEEKAIFGDLTYHFTDQLQGTVGVRYSKNDQSLQTITNGLLGVNNDHSSSRDSAENYLATLSYSPISTLTVYARAASAYRPGGSQAINDLEIAAGLKPTYDPDRLWNYEVGVKGSGWDQRVTYSADVFHMVWTDIQLQVLVNGFSGIANAASAKSDGAEAAIQIVPIDGLTINVKGAYTDAKITSDVPSLGYVNGDALPYAPKITAASLIDYRMSVVNGLTPRVGLTYAYHGSFETTFSSGVRYNLPSYSTLDLRGGVDWSKYSLIARVDNVANKYALTDAGTATTTGSPAFGIVIKPRTFGISLEAHF